VGLVFSPQLSIHDPISLKVWLNPSLIADGEIDPRCIDRWRASNEGMIDAYIDSVICSAIDDTYMNRDCRRGWCLFPESQRDIFYKDDSVKNSILTRLSAETVATLFSSIGVINEIVFEHLHDLLVKKRTIKINYVIIHESISNGLTAMLERERPRIQ
jgi:hypothetical protein